MFPSRPPLVFPAIVFLFSMALVFIPVIDNPQLEFLYATLVMLAGLLFFIPIVAFNKRPGCVREYCYITAMSSMGS